MYPCCLNVKRFSPQARIEPGTVNMSCGTANMPCELLCLIYPELLYLAFFDGFL